MVRRVLTIGGLTAALVFTLSGASQAVVRHVYSGRSSAGGRVKLVTSDRGSGLRIRAVSFATPIRIWTCEDHHDNLGIRGFTLLWLHGGRRLGGDRSFHRALSDQFSDYDAAGTIGPHRASGTFSLTLTEDQEGDTCTIGSLTWEAHRTTPFLRTAARAPARSGWLRA